MLKLRQSVADADAGWLQGWVGWALGHPLPPCEWQHVECDDAGHITCMCAPTLAAGP